MMKIFCISAISAFLLVFGTPAQSASKLSDAESQEFLAMVRIINHKNLPYNSTVMQEMLTEANLFSDRLQLPTPHPIRLADIRYPIVFDPWYSTIKETNYPYFPDTPFGRDIYNGKIPRAERLRALKIGVSGVLETTNFFFSFGEGKLLDVERLSKHEVERYADNLDALIGKTSLIDTNGAYQLATQWLNAVDVDVGALSKLKCTINQLHYKPRGETNYVLLPLFYVDFGSKHTFASGNLPASDEPLISVEILGTSKELQEMKLNDASLSRRPPMILTNFIDLLHTPEAPIKNAQPPDAPTNR